MDKRYKNYGGSPLGYSDVQLTDWLNRTLSGDELKAYQQRRSALEMKLTGSIAQLNTERNELLQQKEKSRQKRFSELLNRENIDTVFAATWKNELNEEFAFKDVKRSQYFNLLKYLIRNSYIDESYADYMTYFYPNSLTTSDKIFLQSITNKAAKEYSFKLSNPALVFSKLNEFDFDEEETLNFSLLTYTLNHAPAENCLKHFIAQLRKHKKFDFVSLYLEASPENEKFIKCINTLWPDFVQTITEKQLLPHHQIWQFAHETLYYCTDESIKQVNIDNCLQQYISDQPDFLQVLKEHEERLLQGLELLNVKFNTIDYEKSNPALFEQTYQKSLYAINFNNIALMLNKFYKITDDYIIQHKNFWAITSQRNTPLIKYISEKMSSYVDIMLNACGCCIEDPDRTVVEFLNHLGISPKQKHMYISYLHTQLSSIKSVSDHTLWAKMLDCNTVVFTESNVWDYWSVHKKIDASLASFINSSKQEIDMAPVTRTCDTTSCQKLFKQIISCKELNNEKYMQLLRSMKLNYGDDFNITGIPNDKMILLIDAKIIQMTAVSLVFMRANYPGAVYGFIRKNIETYENIMEPSLIEHNEVIEILSWDVEDGIKISLLSHAKTPISIANKNYSVKVMLHILSERRDPNDAEYIFTNYTKLPRKVKEYLADHVAQEIKDAPDKPHDYPDNMKIKLLGYSEVKDDSKYQMLMEILPKANRATARACFINMGLQEFAKIFDSHARPKIPKTKQNKMILDWMVEKGWIYEYFDYPTDDNYYGIRRNPPRPGR